MRGISRDYVFEISNQLGLECIEKNIEPYDVYTADEAFMTGTPFCILPVTSLNNVRIGEGKMGVVVKSLLDQWSKNVNLDIVQQIKDYDREIENLQSGSPTPYQFK